MTAYGTYVRYGVPYPGNWISSRSFPRIAPRYKHGASQRGTYMGVLGHVCEYIILLYLNVYEGTFARHVYMSNLHAF